jgi:CRP-like cAMP-binding protein
MTQKKKEYEIFNLNTNLQIYKPDQVIIREGEPYDGKVYILKRGRLAVMLNNKKVTEITDSGVFLGEMSCILGCPRTATIKTLEESEINVCSGGMERIIDNLSPLASKIIVQLASRLKDTTALQVEASARANNLENMYNELRNRYIEQNSQFDNFKQQFEQIQQEKIKKRKNGLWAKIIPWIGA